MRTQIHLPNYTGFKEYLSDYDAKARKLLQQSNMDNPYKILECILCVNSSNPDYFLSSGEISQFGMQLAANQQQRFLDIRYPRYDFTSFKAAQTKAISQGIDRPVLKVFFYLLIKGKAPYSSNGYGKSGEETFYHHKRYPHGVSFMESGHKYRVALVEDTFKFFIYSKRTHRWRLLTDDYVKFQLGLAADEIVPTVVTDFDYIDICSEKAYQNIHDTLQQAHEWLGLPCDMDDNISSIQV